MTKISVAALFYVLGMLNVTASFAQARPDFVLVNRTGVDIQELYVAPHDSDDWQEDILGQDVLLDGDRVNIRFARKEKTKLWDLRVTDDSGNSIEWENFDLTKVSRITLYMDKKGNVRADLD